MTDDIVVLADEASDAAVWNLLDLAKECGAVEDEGEDGKFWTLSLDAFYALEAALRERNISAGWPAPVYCGTCRKPKVGIPVQSCACATLVMRDAKPEPWNPPIICGCVGETQRNFCNLRNICSKPYTQ